MAAVILICWMMEKVDRKKYERPQGIQITLLQLCICTTVKIEYFIQISSYS